jgi:tRNA dimethylallyltransferase
VRRWRTSPRAGAPRSWSAAAASTCGPCGPVSLRCRRAALLERLERDGLATLFSELVRLDPSTAARLGPGDTQRILRALEVVVSTGETLTSWIARQPFGAEPVAMHKVGLTLPRSVLYDAIAARVQTMLDAGWLEEVRALLASGVDRSAPAFQAIGYRQWVEFLDGAGSGAETLQKVVTLTRRFAKRQETWFRREEGIGWWDARRTRECLTSMMEMPEVAVAEPAKTGGIAEPTGATGGGG